MYKKSIQYQSINKNRDLVILEKCKKKKGWKFKYTHLSPRIANVQWRRKTIVADELKNVIIIISFNGEFFFLVEWFFFFT